MYSELVKNLRHVEQGYAERHYSVGEVRVCDMAKDCATAIESITAENAELRKDLCLSCGGYGGIDCETCKWKR